MMTTEVQSTPLLSVQQVSKQFPGVRALDEVSLDLYPGEATACHRNTHEVADDSTTAVLDLGMALLRHSQDLGLARMLSAEAKAMPMSDVLELFLPFLNGQAALNGNHHGNALSLLRDAEATLAPLAPASAPTVKVLDMIQGYKSIALAHLGNATKARQCFDAARPRLESLNNVLLLQRIEEALA